MENDLTELCPICIENKAEYYTECNHGYCIGCLYHISRCAMCRNPLQRAIICNQIKQKVKLIDPIKNIISNNSENFISRRITTISRDGELQTTTYLSVTLPEFNDILIHEED